MGIFVCYYGNQILRRCEVDLKCLYIYIIIWYGIVYVFNVLCFVWSYVMKVRKLIN